MTNNISRMFPRLACGLDHEAAQALSRFVYANPPPKPFYHFTSFLPHASHYQPGPKTICDTTGTREQHYAKSKIGTETGSWWARRNMGMNFTPVSKALNPMCVQRFYSSSRSASTASPASIAGEPENVTTTHVPDTSPYRRSPADASKDRTFAYFMVGSAGFLAAVAAKHTVHDFLATLSASADVLAMGKIEVELASIPEGKNVIVKWRGKPIFIRHRTPQEIEEANRVDLTVLRHPEPDEERVKQAEWLVMLGVCTHLGCVPLGEAGEFGGWYCPCHGSHYDISGRIRKGPAPLNLEIPPYSFNEDGSKLVLGG